MPRKKSQPPAAETNGVNSGALEMVSFTVTVDTDTEAGRRIIAALRNNPDPGALILAGLDAAPSQPRLRRILRLRSWSMRCGYSYPTAYASP